MSWFIKFYEQVFGCWHDWDRWEEPLKKSVQITDETSGAKPTATKESLVQMRSCKKCKQVTYRNVM